MGGFDPFQSGRSSRSNNRTTMKKKKKISWTPELHLLLLEIIMFIVCYNNEDVVPSKVLEVMMNDERSSDILKAMNVQKLTREHVASHLQKLRRFLYTKTRRINKFGIWHRQYYRINLLHEYIKRRQLVKAPPNSISSTTTTQVSSSSHSSDSYCSTSIISSNNNNVSTPSFGDFNVVAPRNYDQTMSSFGGGGDDDENNVAATPPTVYSAQNNNVGQHLTTDFIYNNNQEQGFGETSQLQYYYSTLGSAGYSNWALPNDATTALQGIDYGISPLDLSSLDNFNKEFQDWNKEDWL